MAGVRYVCVVEVLLRSDQLCHSPDGKGLVDVKEVGKETVLTLAAAHALVKLDDGTIVGDPMEKTTLDSMEWTVGNGE